MKNAHQLALHGVLVIFGALTLLPFFFVLNNSFRTNSELFHTFFGPPAALGDMAESLKALATGNDDLLLVLTSDGEEKAVPPAEALGHAWLTATKGYRLAWEVLRGYMINTFIVCGVTAFGVVLLASVSAYLLSRYRFIGHRVIFYYIISTMMFPGVLTFVPSYMLVKDLGLLNTYWAMILPYVAGGQVFATFVFKSFFDGLPEELFESARIDGAGHTQIYLNIVAPLSKPVLSVVVIMTTFGAWNNFLWPFVTNSDGRLHVIASGLFVMATSAYAQNYSTLFAAYMVASLPLLLIFIYATKPFIEGVASGAFKA